MWVVVVVLILVVLLVLAAVGRRQVRGQIDATQLSFAPEVIDRVRQRAQTDKIAAIRELRQFTPGLGLAQAKQMVDRMVPRARPVPHDQDRELDPETQRQVIELKQAGQTIQAIKLIREITGWGLAQAKDYVDGI